MKTVKTIKDLLTEHPFFEGLGENYIDIIAGCGKNVNFGAGKYIFNEGESADSFYILREGNVALEIASSGYKPITIQTLDRGDVFGWSWLYPPYRWFLDAKTIDAVRVVAMDGKCLRDKCEDDPKLGYELMKKFSRIIAQRLQATRLQLLDMYGEKL